MCKQVGVSSQWCHLCCLKKIAFTRMALVSLWSHFPMRRAITDHPGPSVTHNTSVQFYFWHKVNVAIRTVLQHYTVYIFHTSHTLLHHWLYFIKLWWCVSLLHCDTWTTAQTSLGGVFKGMQGVQMQGMHGFAWLKRISIFHSNIYLYVCSHHRVPLSPGCPMQRWQKITHVTLTSMT